MRRRALIPGSRKAIRSQPNKSTPQPVATRSAQDRQEEALDQPHLSFTTIESIQPKKLNKLFTWKYGELQKTAQAHLTEGIARTTTVKNLPDFQEYLDELPPNTALVYGVMGRASARIVTQRDHDGSDDNTITRTRDYFNYPQGPGFFMLDIEEPKGMGPEEFIAYFRSTVPALKSTPTLWRASSSSGLILPDGTEKGVQGFRLYIPVQNASLIPNAAKALENCLWAAGAGEIKISISGNPLKRTMCDFTVYQPERLDFTAAPTLGEGLRRDVPASFIDGDPDARYDLRQLIAAATPAVEARAKDNYNKQLAEKKPEIEKIRETWIKDRAPQYAAKAKISRDQASHHLKKVVEEGILPRDYPLITEDGQEITVGEVMDHPNEWHGRRFRDPEEPDYRGDSRISWLNSLADRPYLYSHAHGGRYYYFEEPRVTIVYTKGDRPQTIDLTLEVIINSGEFYKFGSDGPLVRIGEDGKPKWVDCEWLTDFLERRIQYVTGGQLYASGDGQSHKGHTDAPCWVAKRVLSIYKDWPFPVLLGVINHPILRLNGTLLNTPGYDAESGLFFNPGPHQWPPIPLAPSAAEAKAAYQVVWKLFELFPWVDAVDRGVVLAAIITAILRLILPTAPGFGFNAPTPGTGKSLVAKIIGALTTGMTPPVMPPVSSGDDETRKRIYALIKQLSWVILWDNLNAPFGNAAINAFLTAETFSDRELGKSKMEELPNRAVFMVTGNNLRLLGDTCRRVLVASMDAKVERPQDRVFDFDPVQQVIEQWPEMVSAVLTLVLRWIALGRPRHGKGRMGSFEHWDDLVRQTVCWIATKAMLPDGQPRFADPMLSTQRNLDQDPEIAELRALLSAWHTCFKDEIKSVADLRQFLADNDAEPSSGARSRLRDTLLEIAPGTHGTINSRSLGRWLERLAERPINGLRLERRGRRHGANRWAVVRTHDQLRG